MSDNILSAVLTFSLLAGGTGRDRVGGVRDPPARQGPGDRLPQVTVTAQRAAPLEVVTLPEVTITAQREAAGPAEVVTMPMVVVTGRREAVTVAVATRASETSRIQ